MRRGIDPPRLARALVRAALPEDRRDPVAADLEEMYRERLAQRGRRRARWWYRRQVAAFAGRFLLERLRERLSGTRLLPGLSLLDWKLGARMLLKHPGLSLVGGLALAGAIGVGAAWFELVHEELDPDLPLEDGDRIVKIVVRDRAASSVERRVLHDVELWRDELTTIRELGAYRELERNLIPPDGRPTPVRVAEITASAFPLARVSPRVGRPLLESDERPDAPPVAVLGYEL